MKRILAAIDFLETTDKVINQAKLLAKELKAELMIIHTETVEAYMSSITNELLQPPSRKLIDEQKKKIEDKLEEIHHNLKQEGIKAKCVLMDGPTVDNILKEAEIFKADLIIVGSHKHGKFYNLLMGSVHDSLISHSHIPVLVVPPEKKK